MNNNNFYFKNLTSIRGMAACAVFLSHFLQKINLKYPYENNYYQMGGIGVTLFFVLSGFLITYLLYLEKLKNNSINIRKFYTRRILRIWPLYFFIVISASLLYYEEIKNIIIYVIFFIPTIPFINHQIPALIDPIWSIGVEEQFYLIFPLFFLNSNPKKTILIFVSLILILLSIKLFIKLYSGNIDLSFLNNFLYYERFDNMLIGAIGAFILFFKEDYLINKRILNFIFSTTIQIIIYLSLFIYLLLIFYYNIIVNHTLFSLIFILVILNLCSNINSLINIENKLFNFLGNISFSLYLTHKFSLELFYSYLINFNLGKYGFMLFFLILTLPTSILISYLLYNYIEKPFLKLKDKFKY